MTRSVGSIVAGRYVKYLIIAFWVIVVAIAGPLAGRLSNAESNDAQSWLPGDAESTRALDIQSEFISRNTIPAVVVYERRGGLTVADRAKLRSDARQFASLPRLDGTITGPIVSHDGEAAQIIVPLDLGTKGWSKASDVVSDMRRTARTDANGLRVHITGPAGNAADSGTAFAGIDSTLLVSTIAVVIVILLFTYRSPALWILPVVSAGIALTIAQAVVYLLARQGLTVNAQSAGILTVLVFGASTDYALLLTARYREELRRHTDRHDAMAVALHRAGPSILASGSTVVLGMLCLLLARTNSTKGLGPVAAVGIVVGLAVMLTLLPALLVTVGRWIFWPVRPTYGSPEPTATGVWARIGDRIGHRPRTIWIGTALVLGAIAVGIVQLDATGLTNQETFRGRPDSVVGEHVLAQHFPAGSGSPVVVVANRAKAANVRAAFAQTPGIDAATITPPVNRDGHTYLQGTMTSPPDSPAGYDTVERVRAQVHSVPGADALVGGTTAINLDVQKAARYDRNVIIPVVLAVVLVVLVVLLRALVAALLLTATVILSFATALGASALVFRHLFHFPAADSAFPLFVFVFLVALGIDYNIFLMTRVREEAARRGTRPAARIGLAATGGVITSAGLVLAGTFAVLGTLPLTGFTEIGFAVAFGVLLDTLVVRSILVTALTLDVGPGIWWPSRLSHVPDQGSGDSAAPGADTGRP